MRALPFRPLLLVQVGARQHTSSSLGRVKVFLVTSSAPLLRRSFLPTNGFSAGLLPLPGYSLKCSFPPLSSLLFIGQPPADFQVYKGREVMPCVVPLLPSFLCPYFCFFFFFFFCFAPASR